MPGVEGTTGAAQEPICGTVAAPFCIIAAAAAAAAAADEPGVPVAPCVKTGDAVTAGISICVLFIIHKKFCSVLFYCKYNHKKDALMNRLYLVTCSLSLSSASLTSCLIVFLDSFRFFVASLFCTHERNKKMNKISKYY